MYHDKEKGTFLSKDEITAIVQFASTDELRSNLCGVWIDYVEGFVASTDGHTAAVLAVKKIEKGMFERDWQAFIPAEMLQKCVKLFDSKKSNKYGYLTQMVRIVVKEKTVVLTMVRVSADFENMLEETAFEVKREDFDFKMPAFARVVPWSVKLKSSKRTAGFGFDPDYFARLCKVSKTCSNAEVVLYVNDDELGPIYLECSGYDAKWLVLIMPKRCDDLELIDDLPKSDDVAA